MRRTTANDDNVFDFNSLLTPALSSRIWRCRCGPPSNHLREARDPASWASDVGDRVLSGATGVRWPEGAGDHRRNTRGALHAGRSPTQFAGRQADAAALDRATRGGLGG